MEFPGQLKFQPLCQECDQKSLLEPTQPWIHQIHMGWMQGKICTWFFNSLLLMLSRVIMLTYKITFWYDRVNIELSNRTSELLSCDSVQTAASERVLYLSSWHCLTKQLRHCRAGHDHKVHGCTNTMPKEKCSKKNCSACAYRRSLLCVPSTSKKYLVKSLHQHCHLPHLQHKPNYFPITQKSAVHAAEPKSSYMKS